MNKNPIPVLNMYKDYIISELHKMKSIKNKVLATRKWSKKVKELDFEICNSFIKDLRWVGHKHQHTCSGCPVHPEFCMAMFRHPEKYVIGEMLCWNSIKDLENSELRDSYVVYLKECLIRVESVLNTFENLVYYNKNDLRMNIGRSQIHTLAQVHKKLKPYHELALSAWNYYVYISKIPEEEINEVSPEKILDIRKDLEKTKEILIWWKSLLDGNHVEDVEVSLNGEFLCKM